MKKYIILFGMLGSIVYGYEDLGFPSPELEKGVSGISVDTNYKVINSDESLADFQKDIYRVIKNNNENLFEVLSTNTYDSDYLFNVNVGYLKGETLKTPNVSATFGTNLDEETRAGLNFTYNDFEGNYDQLKTTGNGYQLNLFHQKSFADETVMTTIYAGTLDTETKNSKEKIDNTYWGIHTRYEYLEESYNELFKGYRVDIEGKQLRQKEKSQKNTNDSVKASLKGIVKKNIEIMDNQQLTLEVISGYEREFMDKRVYENVMNDDFKDSLALEAKVSYKYKEMVSTYISLEGRKSLNTSNTESVVSIGIKYNF